MEVRLSIKLVNLNSFIAKVDSEIKVIRPFTVLGFYLHQISRSLAGYSVYE
jgi:hypothetical protein